MRVLPIERPGVPDATLSGRRSGPPGPRVPATARPTSGRSSSSITTWAGAQPEIAHALEIPIGTVKSRLYYATRALRAAIEADDADGHLRGATGMTTDDRLRPADPGLARCRSRRNSPISCSRLPVRRSIDSTAATRLALPPGGDPMSQSSRCSSRPRAGLVAVDPAWACGPGPRRSRARSGPPASPDHLRPPAPTLVDPRRARARRHADVHRRLLRSGLPQDAGTASIGPRSPRREDRRRRRARSRLGAPEIAPDGRIWAPSSASTDVFWILTPSGKFIESWGSPGSRDGQFDFVARSRRPRWDGAIAFAPDGSFWVADTGNHRVQHFDKDRRFLERSRTRHVEPACRARRRSATSSSTTPAGARSSSTTRASTYVLTFAIAAWPVRTWPRRVTAGSITNALPNGRPGWTSTSPTASYQGSLDMSAICNVPGRHRRSPNYATLIACMNGSGAGAQPRGPHHWPTPETVLDFWSTGGAGIATRLTRAMPCT